MRKGFAVAALICAIIGLLAGLNEWFMNQYVLAYVYWEGPLQTLTDLSWLLETLLIGLAVIFLALSLMQKPDVEYLEYDFEGVSPGGPPTLPGHASVPPPVPTSAILASKPPILPELSPNYENEPPKREWPKRLS